MQRIILIINLFFLIVLIPSKTTVLEENSIQKNKVLLFQAIDMKNQALKSSCERQKQLLKKAICEFEKVCEKQETDKTNCARAKLHIASIYEIIGEKDKAISLYESIANDYPEFKEISALAYKYIGIIYTKQKKHEQAIKTFQTILEKYTDQRENQAESQKWIGNNYLLKGEIKKARKEYEKLIQSYDDQYELIPNVYDLIAITYLKEGNRVGAAVTLALYKELATSKYKKIPVSIEHMEAYNILTREQEQEKYPAIVIHTVADNENLWMISGKVYATPVLWPMIYEENKDKIKEEFKIQPGEKLIIRNDYDYKKINKYYETGKSFGPKALLK